jgi:carboxyl-terminal processing protease
MTIIAPMAGSPAELSGLARGDQILSVDGKSIEGLGLNEMVERLRGKPGTRVTLTVVRPSTGQTLEHSLERRLIETRSVDGVRFVSEGIGYISLTNFYEKTAEEFLAAVERLETGGMQALIIDLRNNPGGLLTAAVDVAGVFFRQGETIVYTQGRDERSRQYLRSRNRGKARGLPVAVLINSGSASASEIVAGALQDARRAVIIGETSFGKGLVQSIVPLRGGDALRLTTAQYFTPSGRRIQEAGVPPDIEISLPVEEENQVRLWRSRSDLLTPEQFREIYGQDPLADRQLETAIDALEAVLRSQTISG